MKKIIATFSFLTVLLLSMVLINGCSKDNPVAPGGGTTGAQNTKSFTTSTSGYFTFDNYSIFVAKGTVPKLTNGSDGTVVFSIETKATLDSGISPLPVGYTLVGKYVKFGPDGFNFAYPVKMQFNGTSETSAEHLVAMRYYPETGQWNRVTVANLDTVGRIIGIDGDSPRLGIYALVRTPDKAFDSQGGIEYGSSTEPYWYTLTVKSCTFTYPSQYSWFNNGTCVGYTFSSGTNATGTSPINPVHAHLPQGQYEVWVSRKGTDGILYTYSVAAPVSINNPLVYTGWGSISGWTGLSLPGGGTWVQGSPSNWPTPTVPYGSGVFQATLTWINGSGNDVDLDLHLVMPSGEDVYYGHLVANDSSFALDRDWTHPLGNAIENIYSLKTSLPTGTYHTKVYYFSGSVPKSFNARVLYNGNVTNYSGSLSTAGQNVDVRTFNIP